MVFYSVGITSYFSLNWFFSHRQNAEKSWKSYLSRDDSWMTGESAEAISFGNMLTAHNFSCDLFARA